MKKFAAMTALTLSTALVLSACAGQDRPSDEGDPSGTVSWWSPNWDTPVAEALVAEFETQHPDIDVELVETTWDTMANRIRTALQSGTGPDVITELTSRVPSYAARNELLDLTDWYSGTALPLDDFTPSAIDAVTVDDQIYGVPFRWDAGSMIYNVELFEEAGIDAPPTTTAELRDAAEALSKVGVNGYAWPFGNNENTATYWVNHYYTNGGTIEVEDGAVTIDEKASVAALEDLAWGFDNGITSKSSFESDNTALRELFANGQIGMYFAGAYDVAPLVEGGAPVGTAMWPGPQGPGTISADGFSFIVPADAKNAPAARVLVDFLASTDNEAKLTQTFPARISSSEAERFSDPLLQPFLEQQTEFGMPRPSLPGWPPMSDTIYSAVQRVALGQQTPQDATRDIQAQAANVLPGD